MLLQVVDVWESGYQEVIKIITREEMDECRQCGVNEEKVLNRAWMDTIILRIQVLKAP